MKRFTFSVFDSGPSRSAENVSKMDATDCFPLGTYFFLGELICHSWQVFTNVVKSYRKVDHQKLFLTNSMERIYRSVSIFILGFTDYSDRCDNVRMSLGPLLLILISLF